MLNKSQGYYMKHIALIRHLISGEKFLKCGQLFLRLLLLTSRGQNKIVKIAVFFRTLVFY